MRRLARAGNKVVFVNSISMGLPSLGSRDLFSKLKRKLSSYRRAVRIADDGVIVVSPLSIPFYSNAVVRALNRGLLILQMHLLRVAFDMRDPVLWIAIPTAAGVAGSLGESIVIYQVSDKYDKNAMDHATKATVISTLHDAMLKRADRIYYSGRKLYDEEMSARPELREKSRLLPQAVDFDHFAAATSRSWSCPEDIGRIARPRLGYFGAIESWLLDQKLIEYVSERRPEWQWVALGLKTSTLEVEKLPNFHHLGSKPYSEMPRYASQFDVCVLPWVTDNEFVSYGSAIKVREYLATGKPVVITPLYEYENLDGILRISRGYDDFISKVEDALERDSDARRDARQAAVKDSTWDARTEEVAADIGLLLASRKRR